VSTGSPAFYVVRPLTASARQRMTGSGQEHSLFSSSWTATEDLLLRELRQLGGRDTVLMIDVTEDDLRIDGRMRANARPATPFTALAFTARKKGDLLFCCGRFRTWQDNVRAVALGLEALRKIDRYGITQSAEQYVGFRALPEGDPSDPGDPILRAWKVIADACGTSIDAARADRKTAFRLARKATHPDQGGSPAAFRAVQAAGEILGL
jgi:hypothetical protein